jgi:polar amino acid transport system permease protein
VGFEWGFVASALPILAWAARITIAVACLSFALSLVAGTGLALLRRLGWRPANALIAVYISFIRGTPSLIQIFLIYYVLPVIGIDLPPFVAGVLALAVNSSAFVAEIMRGGLTTVPRGQFEAGRALGLRPVVLYGRIILPQLFTAVLPNLVNEFTIVLKGTALISLITVVEVTRTAQQIMTQNYHPIETFLAAAIVYFVLNFAASRGIGVIEHRRRERLA